MSATLKFKGIEMSWLMSNETVPGYSVTETFEILPSKLPSIVNVSELANKGISFHPFELKSKKPVPVFTLT